ncbi:MAG: sugar phosphate isomerase/epimerase [Candidatus Latescibacteria bacterium]|nr:sugar phosphate isomerase/epimerase [Candidatus Latescibacterota bacterium]
MKLGFLTGGTVEDVRFAARHGFDCLELALFGPTPLFEDHREFKNAMSSEGVELAAVSLFGKNYRDPDEKQRRAHMDLWEKAADLAAALQTGIFVTGAGRAPTVPDEEQWDAVVEELGPRIEGVQRRGLQFGFYNCHWENVVTHPAAWEYLLPKLPGVGVKFDPSHPIYDGRDWMPDLIAAGPHVIHTHAKDVLWVGNKRVPDPNPGLGQIAWGPFFGILYDAGYGGAVCIEPHSSIYGGENRYRFLVLSGRYLRQFMPPEL